MALALDGHIAGSATTSILTTTTANDVILIAVAYNNSSTLLSIADNSGVSSGWAKRAAGNDGSSWKVELWRTTASAAWSGKTITLTFDVVPGFISSSAFGVSGANTGTPFDANGSLPVVDATGAVSVPVTTSNANDMIIGVEFCGSGGGPQAGFTGIDNANFLTTEYMIVSTTQSALAISGDGSDNLILIGDAIQAAGGGGGGTSPRLTLMGVG
jgi:hypothetical protein